MTKKNNKEPLGLDLFDETPDFTKSLEENDRIYRERFKKVYGRYPLQGDENEI